VNTHIDVCSVLRGSVSDLYSNLVTRHTGRQVRAGIEAELAASHGTRVTVIDFTHVGVLDYSCADEIIAKLLLRFSATARPEAFLADGHPVDAGVQFTPSDEAYFVFRGVGDHLDPIEHVLLHHGLAIVVELPTGETLLIGNASDAERLAWHTVKRLGPVALPDVSASAGLPGDTCERALYSLWRRRLVLRDDEAWVAVGAVA
jgi:hypothetical protein